MTRELIVLDIWGVPVLLECRDRRAAAELRRDFSRFLAPSLASAPIHIEVSVGTPPRGQNLSWRAAEGSSYSVLDEGSRRLINYHDKALVSYDYAGRKGVIVAESRELARELAHFAVLSRAGEELDLKDRHRVHALGFAHGRAGAIFVGNSGCGKSTIALAMLKGTPLRILSDDTPLVGPGLRLFPFPLRLSLRPQASLDGIPRRFQSRFRRRLYPPKLLVDWEAFEGRVGAPAQLKLVIIARGVPEGRVPRHGRCPAPAAFKALFIHLVLGTQVPQMAEYLLNFRGGRFFKLLLIFMKRLKTALWISARVPAFYVSPGRDPGDNAALLARMLAERA